MNQDTILINHIENQSPSMDNNSISDDSFGNTTTDSSNLDEDIPF